MNIFFIGPYRQLSFDGIFCRNIIESISSKHSVFIRPIYYDGIDNVAELSSDMQNLEDNDIEKYDCLIQNVKPSDCLKTTLFDKNILIPIIDNDINLDLFIDKTIDKILVDDEEYYDNWLDRYNQTILIDYDIKFNIETKHTFDVGPLSHLKKFYFIGDYKKNHDVILSLVRSFIYLRAKISQEHALVLFVANISQSEAQFLQNYIQQTYTAYGIYHTINKIIVVPIIMNQEHIIAAHNCGDIYLNLNYQPKTHINEKIAQKLGKNIINKPQLHSKSLELNNSLVHSPQSSITDGDIVDSILNYIIDTKIANKKSKEASKRKHITDII